MFITHNPFFCTALTGENLQITRFLFLYCPLGYSKVVGQILGRQGGIGVQQKQELLFGITELYTELYTELFTERYTELFVQRMPVRVAVILFSTMMVFQRFQYLAKHEVYERSGICFGCTCGDGMVTKSLFDNILSVSITLMRFNGYVLYITPNFMYPSAKMMFFLEITHGFNKIMRIIS